MEQPKKTGIKVSGINVEWQTDKGTCTFEMLPVVLMWLDTSLAGLFSGVQAMVGTERFLLALQSEGRRSVEADWTIISGYEDFKDGFAAIASIAAVAGWGRWELVSIDNQKKEGRFRVTDSWEGRYQKSLGVNWGSGMLAGKMAGFCTKLFGVNCWADQIAFIANGDPYDEFLVKQSDRSLEKEIENLLATGEATRADMAVALKSLEKEIEERTNVEEKLRASEQRYRALIETTNTGYVILDVEGKVVDANPEFVRLTGHDSLEEIKGRSVIEWTAEQDRMENGKAVARCLATGFIKDFTVNYVDAAGRITPIELNATVVGEGDSLRILTLCRDISSRLRSDHMLQNAQKLESLGVLAGGIAHDFNNLLTGIFGYIEMARFSLPEGSKASDHINRAMSVFNRARELTRQLLTFSKGSAPVKKSVSVCSVLSETVRFALSGSNVSAKLDVPDTVWNCDADVHQISQVIDNLIINARQAMPLGGIISITARNVGRNKPVPLPLECGNYVMIIVNDSGIGIQPEILPRIFDPFFTTKQQGSGLGLATAYSIIRKHGGHIYAESTPGKGTKMTIYIPAAIGQSEIRAPGTKRYALKHGSRVLVMDDEEFICNISATFLTAMGCSAACAANGHEALEMYRKAVKEGAPFELVILDLTIPGSMGGMQVLEELRTINSRVKAIASSGYSDDPIMAFPSGYGFMGKLSKPYLKEDFIAVVTEILSADEPEV
jgi:PAS domain S-box-containing protein